MAETGYPTTRRDGSEAEERERLESAMDSTPGGAIVVSALAVGLLLLGWLWIYIFVFLPRGPVG